MGEPDRGCGRYEDRLHELEIQVDRLRRRRRGVPRTAWVIMALWVVLLLGAQDAPERLLQVREIVLRDDAGAGRLRMSIAQSEPSLALYDVKGRLRAALTVEAQGPILSMYGADGQPRVVIGARDETAFMVLRDSEGAPRAAMAVQEDGTPSLYLLDALLNPLFREPPQ